ncbi:MAG: hypothetical protein RMI85_01315, partial [Candidatus Korarchaeum sp.]|nr:hypothetical protein [Candidatus Korarchaeum sp.]
MTTYIKFNVIHIILAALIVAALLSYSLSLTNRSSKQLYYGFEDFLGPLSDLSTLLLYVFLTIVITASMHVYRFNSFAVMVFLLIIAIKYVIPQYFDY